MEVELRKKSDFKNPYYQLEQVKRITSIPITNYYKLRFWKEYFFRFSESVADPIYFMDSRE